VKKLIHKLTLIFLLTSSVFTNLYAADLTLQLAPFATTPSSRAAASLGAGLEKFEPGKSIINWINLTWVAPHNVTNQSYSTLSSAFLMSVGLDFYVGGRVGLMVDDYSDDSFYFGFGAASMRYQTKESSWYYEINLGLSGSPYSSFAFGYSI